jgi:hypothetical protein
MQSMVRLSLTFLVLAAIATACAAPVPTPVAVVPSPAAPTEVAALSMAPTTPATGMQPLSADECAQLAQGMEKTLGVPVTTGEVPFTDPSSGASGTCCEAKATGTGEQFESPQAVVTQLGTMLTALGWTEDPMLAAGGPTGMGSGYRKGNEVCEASAQWKPDPSANCPSDQPISACNVKPAQRNYTITLDCAQSGAGQSEPTSP